MLLLPPVFVAGANLGVGLAFNSFPRADSLLKTRRETRTVRFTVFVVASAFAKSTAPEVVFISPCECQGFHGKNRWIAKTNLTPVRPIIGLVSAAHALVPFEAPV